MTQHPYPDWFLWNQSATIILWVSYIIQFAHRSKNRSNRSCRLANWTARISACLPVLFLLQASPSAYVAMGVALQVVGWIITLIACMQLGTSLGLLPAIRSLKYQGMYAYIRHPLYLGELVWTLGWVVTYPGSLNLMIWVLFAASLWLRMEDEENLWRSEPEYVVYCQHVIYRLIPRVY